MINEMIFDDDPLESFSDDFREDELGRNKFAFSLAKSILEYDSKKNLVIGVTGEWGSGKTTLINMVLNILDDRVIHKEDKLINHILESYAPSVYFDKDDGDIVVFNFNPWYFSEQDQLLSYFFLELKAKITKVTDLKNIAKKIEPYAAHVLAAIGIYVDPQRTQASINYLDKIGYFNKDKDLQSLKRDLFCALKHQDKKILIVIDDVDRLDGKEIKQMFKLIKLIANFPNVIYLISFDRKIVEKALSDNKISGEEYLKKIVPVMFEIPSIAKKEIKQQFFELIKKIEDLNEDELNELDELYDYGFKYFFNNIRDLKRFFNTLYFTYNSVKEDVYFIDFTAITAIQVFQSELYNQVRNNINLFAVIRYDLTKSEKIKSDIDGIMDNIGLNGNLGIDLLNFLKIIFPKLSLVYDNSSHQAFYQKWMTLKRIFHEEYFYRYFKFYVPEWDVSAQEIQELLEMPIDDLINFLKDNEKSKLILSELRWYIERNEINPKQTKKIIVGLLNYGDCVIGDGQFKPDDEVEIEGVLTSIYNQIGSTTFLDIFKPATDFSNIFTVCDYATILFKDRDFLKENLNSKQKNELSKFICLKITDILNFKFENIKNPWYILAFYKKQCSGDLGTIILNLSFKEFIFLLSNIFNIKISLEENIERIERNNVVKDNLDVIKEKFEQTRSTLEFGLASGHEKELLNLIENILRKKYKLTYI